MWLRLLVTVALTALVLSSALIAKESTRSERSEVLKKVHTQKQSETQKSTQVKTNTVSVSTDAQSSTEISTSAQTLPGEMNASQLVGEQIKWQVIGSGASNSSSTNYGLLGTVGQIAIGIGTSTNFIVRHGYWQDFLVGPQGCCLNIRGNANGDPEDKVNISDVTFLTSYLFGIPSGAAPSCTEEGNANGDPEEKINISDVTYLTSYLFGIPAGAAPPSCP
jgi:hypothetical protein